MLNHPLRQFMFCAPDEGAAAVVVCRASEAHRYTSKPIFVKATAERTRNLGALEVHGTWASSTPVDGPTVEASRAAYEIAGLGPSDVDVLQIQDTDAGAAINHMDENGRSEERSVGKECGRKCRSRGSPVH